MCEYGVCWLQSCLWFLSLVFTLGNIIIIIIILAQNQLISNFGAL